MRYPWQRRWKPVSVLTGFLGSGKTTVLQHLLTLPEMSGTALIINEFGEVSVDHLLVENAEEKMVLLSNGCVCCSVRGDLVQAIRSLFARMKCDDIPPFHRILLETTGLADPGPIVQSLIGPALANYPVYFDSIATTVDASNVLEAGDDTPQISAQIAVADTLLITKTDLVDSARKEEVAAFVRSANPRAYVKYARQGTIDMRSVFGQCVLDPTASPRELRASIATQRQAQLANDLIPNDLDDSGVHAHGNINSFVVTRKSPLSYAAFDQFMRSLQGYRGQDILRIKGLVYLKETPKQPTVVHGVQGQMHPPTKLRQWPTKERCTQLVFITKEIRHEDVDNLLSGIERGFR